MVRVQICFSDCFHFGSRMAVFIQRAPLFELACLWKRFRYWKMALNLSMTMFIFPNKYPYIRLGVLPVISKCAVTFTEVGRLFRQKASSLWRVSCQNDCFGMLHQTFRWRKRTTMKRLIQLTILSVPWGKSRLEYQLFSGDCNTGQWESHLQMRNKEVCFAYQLLTIGRVAFVVVAFGFDVACHQMALGWRIHFQGNYIGTFWQ